jgi:O-antigen ligase
LDTSRKSKFDLSVFLSSLAIAIILCNDYLTTVLGIYGSKSGGYYTYVMIVAICVALVGFLLRPLLIVTRRYFIILFLIIIYYLATILFALDKTNLSYIDFIGMCVVPIVCGGLLKADYKLVLKISIFFMCISIPAFNQFFSKANVGSSYDAIAMGVSYGMLPLIASGIIHFLFFRKKTSIWMRAMYIVSFVYMINFIIMSYRGALLALVVLLLLAWFFADFGKKTRMKNVVSVIFIIIIAGLIILKGTNFLHGLYMFLDSHNIHIAFLDKTIFLSGTENVTNGRTVIWLAALREIGNSPIWGHGLTTFEYYTGYVFPHNFILQFMFDGGLLLTFPLLFALIKSLFDVFRKYRFQDRPMFAFVLILMCVSIPRLMISAELWRVSTFWLLMGVICNIKMNSIKFKSRDNGGLNNSYKE